MLLEREEKLSAEEKREAELLYEREKQGGGISDGTLEKERKHYSNYHNYGSHHNRNLQINPFNYSNLMDNME